MIYHPRSVMENFQGIQYTCVFFLFLDDTVVTAGLYHLNHLGLMTRRLNETLF